MYNLEKREQSFFKATIFCSLLDRFFSVGVLSQCGLDALRLQLCHKRSIFLHPPCLHLYKHLLEQLVFSQDSMTEAIPEIFFLQLSLLYRHCISDSMIYGTLPHLLSTFPLNHDHHQVCQVPQFWVQVY